MVKTIIDFTPTGMIPTKEMTPYVPVEPNEIIDQVLEAYDLGITKVHIHARENGLPTYKKEIYFEIVNAIRKYSDLVICVSTSGRTFKTFGERSECLDVIPDMASLTLSSLNFNKQESVNSPDMIQALASEMIERGIKPELEAFDLGMINYAKYLVGKELLFPPFYFNLLLGNIACAQADPLYLGLMIKELPVDSYFSVAGIGDSQLMMNSMAIAIGAGIRIGLEDNIWYNRKKKVLAKNIDLLKRAHRIIEANNREVMTPEEFRNLLW